MTITVSTTELENLIKSAFNVGTDSELLLIGRRIGAPALRIVLDVLGGPLGMQSYIPSPDNFAAGIRRTLRDHTIRNSYDGTPETIAIFAIRFGITKTRVRQILATQPGREVD